MALVLYHQQRKTIIFTLVNSNLLVLKWAIYDQFHDYLYYAPSFTVYTDNNPLTYVLSSAQLNATGLHWVNELADFNFTIKYRPVKVKSDFKSYMITCTEEMLPKTRTAITSL